MPSAVGRSSVQKPRPVPLGFFLRNPARRESYTLFAMPESHLHDDRDVEQILKIAVRKSGISDDEALRQRMMAAGHELGLSEAQIAAAEEEYRVQKAEKEELAEYKAEVRKEFMEHLWSYLIVNAGLVGFNLFTKGGIGWAIWPLMGWGIGIAFHAVYTFATQTESFQSGYGEWRKKRQRQERRRRKKSEEAAS